MYLGLVVTVGSEQSLVQGLLLDPEASCASASLVGCPLREGQFPSSIFPLSSHTDKIVMILVGYHGDIIL